MGVISHPQMGLMDLDSPLPKVRPGFNIGARNVIWRGPKGNRRAESTAGTTLVPNSLLPNTGVNLTVGVKYDGVKQRLFFFNYNSEGTHGIYIYYTTKNTFSRLVETGISTTGDPLSFLPYPRIHSIDIIYGDGQSGDLLFFVDSLKRPRKLNIDHLLSGAYTTVKSSYLDVIKAPPIPPPKCVYENDTTVTNNNLVNSLFNFCCTHIYDDFEESVLGSGARQPLPPDPFDPHNNTPASRCARISIYVPTGDQNVKKIRIYGKQVKDGVTIGWFIIDTLIKADLGISDNTVYRYLFYNNGNYVTADPNFTVLDFDYVPQSANTEALLNGNVISYGGITEGYNFLNPYLNITSATANAPIYSINGVLFFGLANGLFSGGQPQITFYLTGVGVNNGFGNPTDLEKAPFSFIISAKSDNTSIGFSYNNASGNRNIATLLFNIRGAATSAGWVFVSSGDNTLTMYYPSGNVILEDAHYLNVSSDISPYQSAISSHYPQSAYSYGVLYRDAAGRTNGVISNSTGNTRTEPVTSGTQIPFISINLSGFQPPPWAVYYEIVRTDTLTYNKYLQWITNAAYANTGFGNIQYAYFGISNIDDYNLQIGATEGVIGYAFNPGDRIKITGRYDSAGNFTSLNLDYAVLGVSVNPIVNGVQQTGRFVQIYYPTNDINSNFNFSLTDTNYQNYKILLYSYKAQNTQTTNVYYQIGQQYGIGNPGTVSAFHMGNGGDNLVQISDGDIFFRQRSIPLVYSYSIPTGAYIQGSPYSTVWVAPGTEATPIVDNGIWKIRGDVNKVAGLTNTTYPTYPDDNQTVWNESANPFGVRIRWTVNVTDVTDPGGQWQMYIKVLSSSNVVTLYTVLPLQTGLVVGTVNTYSIDTTITLPGGSKLWLVNFAKNQMSISGGNLTIDILRTLTINVFDPSFSDIYNLRTNSDNKPNVIDVDATQTYFSTLFRYSEPYQLGTNINNTNRFYPNNYDEFTKEFGDVERMIVWQKRLRVAQRRKWGEVGVYAKFIKNNQGTTDLIVSDTIITPNNIQYYEGDYGVGNQPDCIAINGFQLWFVDPVRGVICRLSMDGITVISETSFIQTYIGPVLPPYLNQYNYKYGGNASILATYDFASDKDSEILFALQPGNAAPGVIGPSSVPAQTLSWNEQQVGFQTFYDYAPDAFVCCENTLYLFSNGVMYTLTNANTYANFFGNQFKPQLTYVFNDAEMEKKGWQAISEISNVPWNIPLIYTETETYPGQRQESKLVDQNFKLKEGVYHSAFLRDIHSPKGWINGDYLKGSYFVAQFEPTDGSKFVFLSSLSLRVIDSPLTVK